VRSRNAYSRQLHGFGVKLTGLESFGDELLSADSMAWSYAARRDHPIKGPHPQVVCELHRLRRTVAQPDR
jgi:hypothetical protein